MPVVMISVATEVGAAAVTLDALEIGAVDFVAKPGATGRDFNEYRSEVASKVRMAAYARVVPYRGAMPVAATPSPDVSSPSPTDAVAPEATVASAAAEPPGERRIEPARERAARRNEARRVALARRRSRRGAAASTAPASEGSPARVAAVPLKRERAVPIDLIAIGASTGGVTAIETLLEGLPAEGLPAEGLPAIVITQHIPSGFSESFAQRLDSKLEMKVHQATDGLPVQAGNVYIAPGGHQFAIERAGEGYVCRVSRDARVNLHRPSVQVLFQSVAKHAGPRALGVMLTGMGADGAQAMLEMRQAGAYNLVQDEATSVVWGMPARGEARRGERSAAGSARSRARSRNSPAPSVAACGAAWRAAAQPGAGASSRSSEGEPSAFQPRWRRQAATRGWLGLNRRRWSRRPPAEFWQARRSEANVAVVPSRSVDSAGGAAASVVADAARASKASARRGAPRRAGARPAAVSLAGAGFTGVAWPPASDHAATGRRPGCVLMRIPCPPVVRQSVPHAASTRARMGRGRT